MELELAIADPWPDDGWAELADRVAKAASQLVPELNNHRLVASLLFTSDEHIHALNREWRDRDKPTNVLSFPMLARKDMRALEADGPPAMIGDIALAHETCTREAAGKSISLEDHAAHLILHGFLHLAGYDHEISDAEAEKMEELEIKVLALMGIADPYGSQNA